MLRFVRGSSFLMDLAIFSQLGEIILGIVIGLLLRFVLKYQLSIFYFMFFLAQGMLLFALHSTDFFWIIQKPGFMVFEETEKAFGLNFAIGMTLLLIFFRKLSKLPEAINPKYVVITGEG